MTKEKLAQLTASALVKDQYQKQLARVKAGGSETDKISAAVDEAVGKLPKASAGSLVIYGDPQSGKTEMMICLTASLLDSGHKTIVHLMNDSVDLLRQNLNRFQLAGLAPAPRNSSDLKNSALASGQTAVLFCKKNSSDLTKLIDALKNAGPVIVIDDEADYATPNAKVNETDKNKKKKTTINDLVSKLLGKNGTYIGVTATPARLNLNNTFDNKTETWVHFLPHGHYTGQDTFFPQDAAPKYRLKTLIGAGTAEDAQRALARFLVTVAHLNTKAIIDNKKESNYSFLVHTSGKMDDHDKDRKTIEAAMKALVSKAGVAYEKLVTLVHDEAQKLYPNADADDLTKYVIANASRSTSVVLNSKRDKASAGDTPTEPTCPFTVIIGGNIVSRGVTFPNLLAMFFTRNVKTKLQQDTYIQRARMFGARGKYLEHFELTIPAGLYDDWHRCFVFHRLALQAIKNNNVSPVWIGDNRISVAAASSIDRGTVVMDKGEMSFQMFDCPDPSGLDDIVKAGPTDVNTLKALAATVGPALPLFLIKYIEMELNKQPGLLAIHTASSVANYGEANIRKTISREKGFIGTSQLELSKFPAGRHHVKIFYNEQGKARVFYKNRATVNFMQNLNG